MNAFHKAMDILAKLVRLVIIVTFSAMLAASAFQVIGRYLFRELSITWTEELSRYLYIWIIFLGATAVLRAKEHVAVDLFISKFPPKVRWVVQGLIIVCSVFLYFCMVKYGYSSAVVANVRLSASLRIPLSWVYASIPVSGVIMLLYTLDDVLCSLFKMNMDKQNGEKGVE